MRPFILTLVALAAIFVPASASAVDPANGGSASESAAPAFSPPPLFFPGVYGRASSSPSNEPIDADEFPLADPQVEDARVYSRWARFPVGSWARYRTTSVSYENNRQVQSVTETRALLKSVDLENRRYELQFESTIKMGAVDYSRKTETALYDFWDVQIDGKTTVEELFLATLMIGSKAVPCKTRRVARENDRQRETSIVWYSRSFAPYVMQRKTVREAIPEEGAARASVVSQELYVVQKLAGRETFGASPARYVARSATVGGKRNQSTTTVGSPAVPGGVLRETTVETRANGETLEGANADQTTTVLLDYYVPR